MLLLLVGDPNDWTMVMLEERLISEQTKKGLIDNLVISLDENVQTLAMRPIVEDVLNELETKYPDGIIILCRGDECTWLISKIKEVSSVPLIAISREKTTEIPILDAGADDYIQLPCHSLELIARITAILRK